MAFHRFAVPSYTGGLPGGYDYINNAISGTPAAADIAKVGGPNAGSYFVAFGEDATANSTNRANRALAENTDFIDNLLRRDLAITVRTGDTGPTGSPTPTVILTGPGIFLGLVGAVLKDLFHITDASDVDLDVAGTKVVVQSVVDAGGVLVGGGFSLGNVTLTFNISVPTGTTYHIYYGQRTNLATIPQDAFTATRIRNAVEVDFDTEELFRLLHGNNLAWNAAWTTTIFDLGTAGLDDRYRHRAANSRTALPEPFLPAATVLDTPGAGSYYVRDGAGMAGYSAIGGAGGVYSDPFNALWKAKFRDTFEAGSVGFVSYGKRRATSTANENIYKAGYAAFLHLVEHPQAASIGAFRTNLMFGDTCTIQLSGGFGVVVVTQASHYFALNDGGTLKSSIAAGADLLEVNWDDGSGTVRPHTYIVHSVVDGTTLRVLDLTGQAPAFPGVAGAATLGHWLSPQFMVGDGSPSIHTGGFSSFGLFHSAMPARSSGGVDTGPGHYPAEVYAQDVSTASPKLAFSWGGFQADLTLGGPRYIAAGFLYGDGRGLTNGLLESSHITTVSGAGASSDVTISLLPHTQIIDCTYTGVGALMTVTVDVATTPIYPGGTYTIIVKRHSGCTVTAWALSTGGSNLFGGTDQDLQTITPSGIVYDRYQGYAVDGSTILWTVDRFGT